jgi:hypothetical protein
VLSTVACGTGHDAGGTKATAPTRSRPAPPPAKVAPRWDRVTTFAGRGDDRTASFDIAPGMIQWRVTATCSGGRLRVALDGEAAPLAEPACPGRAFGFSIRPGPAILVVAADGGWGLAVDRQVDTPIAEPALDGMTPRARVAQGELYDVDQHGAGRATLYRLPDGRRGLRLDPLQVTNNTDLFVWLSDAAAPRTSKEAFESRHVQVEALKATAGPQNYVLPSDVPFDVRSVVVWCEPVQTAYAAATLRPV